MQLCEVTGFSNDAPVRAILQEYVDTLPFDISYQRFDQELDDLAALYGPAVRGALFIAVENETIAGCVALKRIDETNCEMKRLYVRPAFRGKHVGLLLIDAIVKKAVALGYRSMKLDTHVTAHKNAIALYKQFGFRETTAYHDIPHALLFLELDLDPYKTTAMLTSTVSPMHKVISDDLSILEFEPQHAQAFRDLNVAWITKGFFMEESDEIVLSDPYTHILAPGGSILVANYKGAIVGTCALANEGHGIYELTKMAVDESCRGLKIGWHLGVATLEKAKQLGAEKVLLHSNRKGSAAAIALYYKLGFVEIPLGNAPWARADIKMEIAIDKGK